MSVTFDARAAVEDLQRRLLAFVEHWTLAIFTAAESGARSSIVRESLKQEVAALVGSVTGEVLSTSPLSFVEEFGSGRFMDTANSALGSYIGGDTWNPLRPSVPGAAIMGRPAGTYQGLLGTKTSRGLKVGVELPQLEHPPTHFMSDAVKVQEGRIYEDLQGLLASWIAGLGNFMVFAPEE